MASPNSLLKMWYLGEWMECLRVSTGHNIWPAEDARINVRERGLRRGAFHVGPTLCDLFSIQDMLTSRVPD